MLHDAGTSRFHREFSVPLQHELAERDVSPEEREGEQEFAQIVKMFGRHALDQQAAALKKQTP